MSKDFTNLSGTALARLIRTGETSSRDVLEAHISRLVRVNLAADALLQLLEDQPDMEVV